MSVSHGLVPSHRSKKYPPARPMTVARTIVMPIVTYPITKLMWLTFDLIFRPPHPGDFAPAS